MITVKILGDKLNNVTSATKVNGDDGLWHLIIEHGDHHSDYLGTTEGLVGAAVTKINDGLAAGGGTVVIIDDL